VSSTKAPIYHSVMLNSPSPPQPSSQIASDCSPIPSSRPRTHGNMSEIGAHDDVMRARQSNAVTTLNGKTTPLARLLARWRTASPKGERRSWRARFFRHPRS